MFTIEKAKNREGYVINTPERGIRSKPVYVKTPEEIVEAIKHYYGMGNKHNKTICSFCKIINN